MARRIESRSLRKPSVTIIGEGITEQFYFTHIRTILGYHFTIKPYYFSVTSLVEIDKKIAESIRDGGFAIAVFDADVANRNDVENKEVGFHTQEIFQEKECPIMRQSDIH